MWQKIKKRIKNDSRIFFFFYEELVRRMKMPSTEMGKAADGANLGEESGWFGTLVLYLLDVKIIHPKVLSVIM